VILLGKTFGMLKVLSVGSHRGRLSYLCLCECGGRSIVAPHSLTSGNTKSCGCMRGALKPYAALYNRIRYRATSDGIKFGISFKYFLRFTEILKCHYCHYQIVWHKKLSTKNRIGPKSNLDRKDSTKGYVKGNLVVCCKLCNFTKADRFSYEEFLLLAPVLRKIQTKRIANVSR
jgi:hypothetical protein